MTRSDAVPRESWTIPSALDGQRVDRALALLTGLARRQVSELIEAGQVAVGITTVKSRSRRVHAGEQIRAAIPAPVTTSAPSPDESVEVAVVWSDEHLAVIDKPAGLVVHPGSGHPTGTLVHGLLARFPELAALDTTAGAAGDRDRPGIVHRLDKGTSGLLMIARTAAARRSLVAQLAARSVERRYAAMVHGWMDSDEGVVDAPLGRSSADPTRMAVVASGRPARTHYRVIARSGLEPAATLLECQLESGRTHQVRVHLAAIGHPVIGDPQYRGSGGRSAASFPAVTRMWLHARVLGFDHPVTGERLRFESPLPPDLAGSVAELGVAGGCLFPGWARD